ncbi:permease-like cell division protein FtsX [Saccharospirillum mangrovi]|uniref:permease-like cell division protein FtsX n=1 Tax=Saccharospirillum mangrovi TaxID=2161747 RepID=UPI000D37F02E|nr:permease-like cell division protein FtsX [Saccharospirillum mangrovi]
MTAQRQQAVNRRRDEPAQGASVAWFRHHRDCAVSALMRLVRNPVSSALTWLVIAISLTLPTLFYLALASLENQTERWQAGGQITLYLTDETTLQEGQTLTDELAQRPEVISTRYINADDAWQSFSQSLTLDTDRLQLESNPLPASIVLVPNGQSSAELEALRLVIDGLPQVEDIQLDLAWIDRLNRFLELIATGVTGLAILLGVAVLLVVGNTIRLAIESRKEEIRIVKLLGATEAFIKRPFLYLGLWYGLLGGLAAWVLVSGIAWWLHTPLSAFLETYGLDAHVTWLNLGETLFLLLCAMIVSWIGTHIALWRHLRDAEPR